MRLKYFLFSLVCVLTSVETRATQIHISRDSENWLPETARIYGSAKYGRETVIIDNIQISVMKRMRAMNDQQETFPLYFFTLQDLAEVQRRLCIEVGGESEFQYKFVGSFHQQATYPVIRSDLNIEFYLGHELNTYNNVPKSPLSISTFRTLHCKVSNSSSTASGATATIKVK